jgi:hypothetical protein
LREAILGEWDVFASLDPCSLPGQFEVLIGVSEQLIYTFDAVLDLFAAGFADLTPHLAMCAGDAD